MGEPIPIVEANFDKGEIYSLYKTEEDGKVVYALMFHAKESSYTYSQILCLEVNNDTKNKGGE
jgi:hypothetical protein